MNISNISKTFFKKAPDVNCTSCVVARDENTKLHFHNHCVNHSSFRIIAEELPCDFFPLGCKFEKVIFMPFTCAQKYIYIDCILQLLTGNLVMLGPKL